MVPSGKQSALQVFQIGRGLMQGINTEMMAALRSQTGDVKATQKLEQQEADTSPETAETMSEGGDQCPKA